MKTFNFFGAIAIIISLCSFTISNSISWKIADNYSIKFNSKNPSGVFTKLTGDVEFDENNLADSKLNFQVDVASINTGNGMKNKHAKGKKWFNAKQFPTINFIADDFKKTPTGYEAMGTLEMHGIKKEYTIPFTFNNNTFKSNFIVNRTDFNVGAVKGMAKKVPHEMNLEVSIPVTK